MKTQKPPIGLKPKKIHTEQRVSDVKSAIIRYLDNNMQIPNEWIDEYNELQKPKCKSGSIENSIILIPQNIADILLKKQATI